MKSHSKQVLFGLYNDEEELMAAISGAKSKHLDIMDVYSPFPIHGMEKVLGLEESRLHIVGFIFGMIGTLTAFLGMTWIFTSDWPTIFGGKPYFSLPAFVPIIFELTVLFAAIAMTVVFYIVCGLGFGVENPILDDRITDDKFCLAFQTNGLSGSDVSNIKKFLKESGAAEIHEKEV
ncbi:MAG: DUF3341 domain-containing protein [Saprospiraceae bacterium]